MRFAENPALLEGLQHLLHAILQRKKVDVEHEVGLQRFFVGRRYSGKFLDLAP